MNDLSPTLQRYFPRSTKALVLVLAVIMIVASLPAATLSLVFALDASRQNAADRAAADQVQYENQLAGCKRGNDIRQGLYTDAQNERTNALLQASQANDPEVEHAWRMKAASEAVRMEELERQAEANGYRIPNTVQSDCTLLIDAP